ncbi:hypothetical protein [Dietzia lutea]|uniref:hypothetical protein n=1 Tax=Dietzia lutea TaxID=546160 RepID=UPI001FCA19A6|nr:hypothetical protein [Dietzia lutea]
MQGLSSQDIAERCYLSANSVKSFIRSVHREYEWPLAPKRHGEPCRYLTVTLHAAVSGGCDDFVATSVPATLHFGR